MTAVALMFVLGLSFNAGRVLNVSLTAIASSPEQRGVFMAVVGIYWASGQMLGPLLFGPLAAVTSLTFSFIAAGALMTVVALLTPLLYAASRGESESRQEA
jgi:MFS family permease